MNDSAGSVFDWGVRYFGHDEGYCMTFDCRMSRGVNSSCANNMKSTVCTTNRSVR